MEFARWHHGSRGTQGEMVYMTRLSFEGLLDTGLEPDTLRFVVAGLGGEIIQILPRKDQEIVTVDAWLKDVSVVPKLLDVEVPVPDPLPWQPDSLLIEL